MGEEFKDFVFSDSCIEFDVEGLKFGYKPANGEDEDRWLPRHTRIVEEDIDGNIVKLPKTDHGEYNRCKLENIVRVPYPTSVICGVLSKITGTDHKEKEWMQIDSKLRVKFLEHLRAGLRNLIIAEIFKIDEPDEKVKKN